MLLLRKILNSKKNRIGFVLFLCAFLGIICIKAQPGHTPIDKSMINKIRKEVECSKTEPFNVRRRARTLNHWARSLIDSGINIQKVFPRKDAHEIKNMIESGRVDEACAEIDRIYKKMEEFISGEEETDGLLIEKKLKKKVITLNVDSSQVLVCAGMPNLKNGSEIKGKPVFYQKKIPVKNGSLTVEVSQEPLWIIDGELAAEKRLPVDDSPFGFHPASIKTRGLGKSYKNALDIGVAWDRDGLYLYWALSQPDRKQPYKWKLYDNYFRELPEEMRPFKNITTVPDGAVEVEGRRKRNLGNKRKSIFDVSQYIKGSSYIPSDVTAYSNWVQAAVERYDGDGKDDMPGLKNPVKYWQVDNEPPRLRDGYSELVKITAKAIKAADPEAKVVLGGLQLPSTEEKIRNYFRSQAPILEKLKGEGADVVDFHWFGKIGEWKKFASAMSIVKKDLKKYGFSDKPIWITEMGTYSGLPKPRRGNILPFQSERQQASEMLKRYAVACFEGVKKIFWAWGMKEGFIDIRDNDFFDNTGFIYDGIGSQDPGDGVKKIIYFSYQKMTDLLAAWDGNPPSKLNTVEGVWAYKFCFKNSRKGVIIIWSD